MNVISPLRYFLAILSTAALASSMLLVTACGSSDADVDGTITQLEITPEAGYPDVEVTTTFTIDTGSEEGEPDGVEWRVDFGDGSSQNGSGLQANATHSYDDVGTYTITVDAIYEGSVVDTDTRSFDVFDPASLSVSTVRAQPVNLFVGEDLTVSFSVSNDSANPVLTAFDTEAYLSPDPDVTRADLNDDNFDSSELYPLGRQHFELDGDQALAGGSDRDASITAEVPDLPSGQYYAIVVIDPDQRLQLTSDDNTAASSPNQVSVENVDESLPNIAVSDLEVVPDRAFPELNDVTRAFTLQNLGGADVFNVVTKTYLQVGSPELDDDAILIGTSDPVNLSAQQERIVGPDSFVLNEPIEAVDGEKEVWVIVEAFSEDGDVVEANDTNNILASDPIIVSDDPVDGPDLAVEDFHLSPDSTFLDGTLQLETTIANLGTADASSFFCGIYMGLEPQFNADSDPRVTTLNIAGLDAGDVHHIDRAITIPGVFDPGTYYFYIVCDPVNALNQPFRGNSQALFPDPIQVTDEADIELSVGDITLPSSADDGDTITIDGAACVVGSNPTGAITGEVYFQPGQNIDFDEEPQATFDIANVDPGQCETFSVDIEATCQDFISTMRAGVIVDADESLPLEDRDPTRATSDQTISMNGPFCECEEDDFGNISTPANALAIDPDDGDDTLAGSLCGGGCDFFEVPLSEGDSLVVESHHDRQRGSDLRTTLFVPGGSIQIDQDDSGETQSVGLYNAAGDDIAGDGHIFSVCSIDSGGQNYYDLTVDRMAPSPIVDVIPQDISIPPQDTFSVGAPVDVDLRIYNIGAEASDDFQAEVLLVSDNDPDVLDDPSTISLSTHTIDAIGANDYRDVVLETTLPTGIDDGDYYLAIDLDPDGELNEDNTDNNLGFSPPLTIETLCFDAFTPNDSIDLAASIDPGVTYANLTACQGQSDYFTICAPNAHSLTLTIDDFDPADGDLDLTLLDQTQSTVATSAQSGVDLEEITVDYVDGEQCYTARVDLISLDDDAEQTYRLSSSIEEVDASLQCDSTFEPNDNFQTASSLLAALNYDQLLDRCPVGDQDFYYVELSSDDTLDFTASLDPSDQPGTLTMQLYRPGEIPDAIAETGPGQPTATIENYQPPTTGTYYLQISISGSQHRVTYDLDVDGLSLVDLAVTDLTADDSSYEPGDSLSYSANIHNQGTESVDTVDYHLYLGESSSPSSDDQLLGDFEATNIDVGDSVDVSGQISIPSSAVAGDRYLHLVVDPDDLLDDINRSNNRDTVSIEITDPVDDDGDA